MRDRGEEPNRLPKKLRIVRDAINVGAHFEVVSPVPLAWGQIQIGQCLPAAGVGFFLQIVVSKRGQRGDLVWLESVGSKSKIVLIKGEPSFEKLSTLEIMLVFQAADIGGFHVLWVGELRILR